MNIIENMKIFAGSEGNVWKYVFENNNAIMEAVLYKYENFYKRTVICCSTMSGCPVGCMFCGTGHKFIRNLNSDEIVSQIYTILKDKNILDVAEKGEKTQFMFMSMGEPLLNWDNVEEAIRILNREFPKAQLLISTIAPCEHESINKLINLSKEIDQIGLQFSIHKSNNEERNKLIPYEDKLTLQGIRDFGTLWWKETGRKPYLNYCIDGTNNKPIDADNLKMLFSPMVFCITFSVVCSANETMKDAGFKNLDVIRQFEESFLNDGYNTRIFDPAGQDDIGGGCGQLWYVQKWMKEHNIK